MSLTGSLFSAQSLRSWVILVSFFVLGSLCSATHLFAQQIGISDERITDQIRIAENGAIVTAVQNEQGQYLVYFPVIFGSDADGQLAAQPVLSDGGRAFKIGLLVEGSFLRKAGLSATAGLLVGWMDQSEIDQMLTTLIFSFEKAQNAWVASTGVGYAWSIARDPFSGGSNASLRADFAKFTRGKNQGASFLGLSAHYSGVPINDDFSKILPIGFTLGLMRKVASSNPAAQRWLLQAGLGFSITVF